MVICPVCGEKLTVTDRSYSCVNGHRFDMAREGYINLLLSHQKRSAEPGDPKESVRSRRDFLDAGYYESLAAGLARITEDLLPYSAEILDAGVGTGYYLDHVIRARKARDDYYAIDIGKEECRVSAKRAKQAQIAVASVFRLPYSGNSFDLVMSVFTPYSAEEFFRVVKPGGYVIAVQPGKRHLYELKEVVYDDPYENEEKGYDLPGFELVRTENILNRVTLRNHKDIMALWNMTPYVHKTSRKDTEKLDAYETLEVTTDFYVTVYRKEDAE
ncbi:MAG: methyltransferase domain-containing protein [Erysipelotrichales bacterium]|nr:methyltransferase domain-containing protein [Erysipelotrichales bacterium]